MGRVAAAPRDTLLRFTPEAAALLLVAVTCWVLVVWLATGMGSMPGTMGLGPLAFVGVWVLMMAAMMLPSVAPVASLYARSLGSPRVPRVLAFVAGYLVVWSASSLPAYAAALGVDQLAGHGATASRLVTAGAFLTVALYQVTPLKRMCLEHCRSPLSQLLHYTSYRGRFRDLRVGLHHGAFCIGCCWALFLLIVVLGTMNVLLMVGLAGLVLLEKYFPWGIVVARVAAIAAAVLAIATLAFPQLAWGMPAM